MNERIKEIMFQSGLGYMSSAHPILVEKFAELIVRECMCISDSIGEHGYIAAEEMGKHFGVEE